MATPLRQFFWLIDTRPIWHDPTTTTAAPIAATAATALSLLPDPERTKATRFHFLRDAKLSLASSLLKRHFITSAYPATLPAFSTLDLTRRGDPKHGKPAFAPPPPLDAQTENDFNVSHQAGLVALAGYARPRPAQAKDAADPTIALGVDITNCVERRAQDTRFITRDGFDAWVDMHGEVFSPADLAAMKAPVMDEFGVEDDDDVDVRRRRFYAYWCLKEAYVKLEGEALLAGWLKEVEFRRVRVPEEGAGEGVWGEKVEGIEVWRSGRREADVQMTLWSWGREFMVGLAVKGDTEGVLSGQWSVLDVEGLVREKVAGR